MLSLIDYLKIKIKQKNNDIVRYDELIQWPIQEVQDAKEQDYLRQLDDAGDFICDQCPQHCCEFVEVRQKDGKNVGVITCQDNENGGMIIFDVERLQQWRINAEKLGDIQSHTPSSVKKRPTQKQMEDRNRSVAYAVGELKMRYDRLPTVDEIVEKTGFSQQQIYQTASYKEGKIAKKNSKLTDEVTGSSIATSEFFGAGSIEQSRKKRQTKAQQAEIDALIDEQNNDDIDYVR